MRAFEGVGLTQGALGWAGLGWHRNYASDWHKAQRDQIKISRTKTRDNVIVVQNRERATAVPYVPSTVLLAVLTPLRSGVLKIVFFNEHELQSYPDRRADLINLVFNSEEAQIALKHGRSLGIIW